MAKFRKLTVNYIKGGESIPAKVKKLGLGEQTPRNGIIIVSPILNSQMKIKRQPPQALSSSLDDGYQ
jgi:hypothetical protein